MRYEIEFVEGQIPDALVTVSGEMTVEGNQEWLGRLVGDPRWRPGMKTLVDGTALEAGTFFGGEVWAVADTTVAEDEAWGAGFSAVVVDEPRSTACSASGRKRPPRWSGAPTSSTPVRRRWPGWPTRPDCRRAAYGSLIARSSFRRCASGWCARTA